jgi:NAD(P)H-dependent FMN reductase
LTTKPRIAIVIDSTRPGRYADKAAGWMLKQVQAREDMEAELLDLLDHRLLFFDEKGPLISVPSENAEALRWLTVSRSLCGRAGIGFEPMTFRL